MTVSRAECLCFQDFGYILNWKLKQNKPAKMERAKKGAKQNVGKNSGNRNFFNSLDPDPNMAYMTIPVLGPDPKYPRNIIFRSLFSN